MIKRFPWLLLVTFAALVTLASTADAQQGPRFILRAPASLVGAITARHGLATVQVLRDDVEQTLLVEGPAGMAASDLDREIDSDADVISCEQERGVHVAELAGTAVSQSTSDVLNGLAGRTLVDFFGSPSPSNYVRQPAAEVIELDEARTLTAAPGSLAPITGSATVAIIDTGVDETHPLLRNVVIPGYDFTRNIAGSASDLIDLTQSTAAILEQSTAAILEQNTVITLNQSTAAILEQSTAAILEGLPSLPGEFGHGTMVAGLVHFVAPTAKILPLKAFNADGTSNLSDIIRAIYYAVDNGARVINMSFSLTDSSQALMRAVAYATTHNVICVAAVGNGGKEMVVYPAAYRNVIAVASTSNTDQLSVFSDFGDAVVTLAAPGEALITTYPGGHYAGVAGTSFSSALVSGGVALMLDAYPPLTPRQADSDLGRAAATVAAVPGLGRLDVARAISRSKARKD
jgi:subtilisin family serine protease